MTSDNELNPFKKEKRYIVIKLNDLENMSDKLNENFSRICNAIAIRREESGKDPLECVVVESDWGIYDQVWQLVQQEYEGNRPAPSVNAADSGELVDYLESKIRPLEIESKTYFGGDSTAKAKEHNANRQARCNELILKIKSWVSALTNQSDSVGSDKIKEVLKQALYVADSRSGDISTEDGSFGAVDVDELIRLEEALCSAFGVDDDVDVKLMLPKIEALQTQAPENAMPAVNIDLIKETELHIKMVYAALNDQYPKGGKFRWMADYVGEAAAAIQAQAAENAVLREGMKGDYDLDAWLDWVNEKQAQAKRIEDLDGDVEKLLY